MTEVVIPHTKYAAAICQIGAELNESRQFSTSRGPALSSCDLVRFSSMNPGSPSGLRPLSEGLLRKKIKPVGRASNATNPSPTHAVRQFVAAKRYIVKGTKIRLPADTAAELIEIANPRRLRNQRAIMADIFVGPLPLCPRESTTPNINAKNSM